MSIRSIHFKGMIVGDIRYRTDTAEIRFDYASIIKNMDGAEEDTRWFGAGLIKIEELAQQVNELPAFPLTLSSGDIRDNQMIYRDEISIPFSFHGNVGIHLHFVGSKESLKLSGEKISLELKGQEKYIEHIKAG